MVYEGRTDVRDDFVFLRLAVFGVVLGFLLCLRIWFCHCAVFICITDLSFLLSKSNRKKRKFEFDLVTCVLTY